MSSMAVRLLSRGKTDFMLCSYLHSFLFPSMFNWCNAILTDNLTRTKEEGVTLQRRLDQTLSEIFNIWPSCTLPLSLSPSGSLKWLLLLMLGFVLTYSMCPRTFVTKRKPALHDYHSRPWWAPVSADTVLNVKQISLSSSSSFFLISLHVGEICTFVGKVNCTWS